MKGWRKLPLKTRLSLLFAVLLMTCVLVVGVYSYWNLWHLLLKNKASHIRARAKPIINHWVKKQKRSSLEKLSLIRPEVEELAQDLTSREAVAEVFDAEAQLVASGRVLREEPIPPPPSLFRIKEALRGNNEITYLYGSGKDQQLVILIPIRPSPTSTEVVGVIQISTYLFDVTSLLFKHGSMLLAVVGIILSMGSIVCFKIVSRELRGLGRLSRICKEIQDGNFSPTFPFPSQGGEIGELITSFRLMVGHLNRTFASQRRFIANAAHELLTPLTGIKGSLEVLLWGCQDDPASVRRLARGMLSQVERLIRTCDRLLGLSSLENMGNIKKTEIDLCEFFQEVEREASLIENTHRIVVKKGPCITLRADRDMLKQMVFNLISNATKFSPPSSVVEISWEVSEEGVNIQVRDEGVGIDSNTLERVFEPFFHTPSPYTPTRGTGLGLPLTKAMIEAHGGRIHLSSCKGKGTVATLFFPSTLLKS